MGTGLLDHYWNIGEYGRVVKQRAVRVSVGSWEFGCFGVLAMCNSTVGVPPAVSGLVMVG